MKLIEFATGFKSSEYSVVVFILLVLGCQALGVDVALVLPLVFDTADVLKYEELARSLGSHGESNAAATWALAAVGIAYPVVRAYVKKLKTEIIRGKEEC
jgi:hypothetical protein